ncbi:hypothetical protein [Streptomyces mirabilis]|uniref:hypothetical protein n=1 Tax=Streptomyces mirabilis TaxID=68239 RepID=UPI0036998A49
MWRAARHRGIDAPDWAGTIPPGTCVLSPDRYCALLAERVICVHLNLQDAAVKVAASPDSVVRLWIGETTTLRIADGVETTLLLPPPDPPCPSAGNSGAAVFTGGNRLATGRIGAHATIHS